MKATQHTPLVIFDCDGTLVDTEYTLNEIERDYLAQCGYNFDIETCIRTFCGSCSADMPAKITALCGTPPPAGYYQDVMQLGLARLAQGIKPLLPNLVHKLHQQGIPMCVASNNDMEKVRLSLHSSGIDTLFAPNTLFSAQQVKQGKPAPDLFLHAAQKMGYQPSDCIVIEDSPFGIQAAQAAGMRVFGFLGGGHATFDWYKQRLEPFDIPIAHNEQELVTLLSPLLGTDMATPAQPHDQFAQ